MALLTQLLGNREQAFEDNLEKGRIWFTQMETCILLSAMVSAGVLRVQAV